MKVDYWKIIRISVGCCISVLLANAVGLASSTSAGIITLLSIQNTKKETIAVASRRIAAFFPAMAIAMVLFTLLGFRVAVFGLFLFCFVLVCYRMRWQEGISMNTVLVTHLFSAKQVSGPLLLNEFLLLCIGVGIGILINMLMPRNLDLIKRDQREIDGAMSAILRRLALALAGEADTSIDAAVKELRASMGKALERAYETMKNSLLRDTRYYAAYMEMRIRQCGLLGRVARNLARLQYVPEQALVISVFLFQIADSFHERNNAIGLLEELERIRAGFHSDKLPATRIEFEARAVLFQMVSDLEYLLLAKKAFAESLTPEQIKTFWAVD